MGYLVIKLFKRQDITQVGSGSTGGTNAMRAGGIWMGLITGLCDLLKGFLAIWIARTWMPGSIWIQVLAGAAAVFGHNWSIWLYLITKTSGCRRRHRPERGRGYCLLSASRSGGCPDRALLCICSGICIAGVHCCRANDCHCPVHSRRLRRDALGVWHLWSDHDFHRRLGAAPKYQAFD